MKFDRERAFFGKSFPEFFAFKQQIHINNVWNNSAFRNGITIIIHCCGIDNICEKSAAYNIFRLKNIILGVFLIEIVTIIWYNNNYKYHKALQLRKSI